METTRRTAGTDGATGGARVKDGKHTEAHRLKIKHGRARKLEEKVCSGAASRTVRRNHQVTRCWHDMRLQLALVSNGIRPFFRARTASQFLLEFVTEPLILITSNDHLRSCCSCPIQQSGG